MTLAAVLCIGSAILMIIQDIIEYNTSKKEYSNVVDEFVSFEGEIPFDNYIRIDNSNLSAKETAKMIKEKFDL